MPSRYNLGWVTLGKQIRLTFFKQCIDEYNLSSNNPVFTLQVSKGNDE